VLFRADGWAAGAPAQAPVAGVFQRAVERSCGAGRAPQGRREPQERWLAVAPFLACRLPVLHRAMRLSLPSEQWHFAIRRHFLRPRLRDSRPCRDKSHP
jgi:hypothetical protein